MPICIRECEMTPPLTTSVLSQPMFQDQQVNVDIIAKLEELLASVDRYRTHYETNFNSGVVGGIQYSHNNKFESRVILILYFYK